MEEVMKKSEQIRHLKEICETYKVPFDLIDFNAMVDSKLHYDENKTILLPMIEILSQSTEQKQKDKVETDYGKKGTIKGEKEAIERVELDNLKKEAEVSEAEFEKAINSIKFDMKSGDFLEEFRKEQLKTGFEIQWFLDEILTERSLNNKPTIFTFANPVAGHGLSEENALSSITAYGQYMCMLSQLDMKPISKTLRIRVESSHE
jgi:hypothetical protein